MSYSVRVSCRVVLVLAGLIFSVAVQAHRFAPSLLKVNEIKEQQYHWVWKTPAQATSATPLKPQWPASCEVTQINAPQSEGTARVSSWQMRCEEFGEDGLVGETLSVAGLAENQASVMIMVSLRDGRTYQQVLNASQPEFLIPQKPSSTEVIGDYCVLGIEHIWGGIDHLLFVFGLLLLVGGGARLLLTITAFTVGHSITLSLVTLGFFDYPVALIEAAIAFSIFILAVELTRESRNDMFVRNPWWLAGGFGLLHGMGFAGALAETGLPQGSVPLALLFFNIGIEIGQIAFIVSILALWYVIKKPLAPWQRRLKPIPSYVLGSLAALWCIERGLEVFS